MALNMETNYCGFRCETPFFLASSPVSATGEMIGRAFELGWAGAVTKSISYLQDELNVSLSPRMLPVSTAGAKGVTGMGNIDFVMDKTVDAAFADFAQVKKKYPEKMLIISVKAQYLEREWKSLARKAEDAGADALELCLSCIDSEAGAMICQEKELMQQVIRWVKEEIQIPVIAKLSIHVSDVGKMARYAAEAGADGVTGINSIHGIGPINADTMVHMPDIMGKSAPMGLSGAFIKPMAQHCIYKMAKAAKEQKFDISAVGGICNGQDALEYLLLGADTLQSATAVMYQGYGIIRPMMTYLQKFMEEKGYQSLDDFRGYSLEYMAPAARNLSLKQQLAAKVKEETCIGCGRCVTSCQDGGKQAISLEKEKKKAFVHIEKCTGCGLCQIVCPVKAIDMEQTVR
ncbi:MAG: NAD-dependent dihydropyrimidine dehydrogenase subunit PreA [Lachnospiraceae bacterium]